MEVQQGGDAGRQGGAAGQPTDLNTLHDAVLLAGIDLNAEEEVMKQNLSRRAAQSNASLTKFDTTPLMQDLVNRTNLQKAVTAIASDSSMRTLKSDTLDLLTYAIQYRLRGLMEEIMAARNHRVGSNPTRPPPLFEENGEPMWDQNVHDDVNKILRAIDRTEKEEERQARRERMEREELEAAERGAQQALLAEEADADEDGGRPKKKAKKKESAAQAAKNMPEEMQKKMSDSAARHTLFGGNNKYSWLGAGNFGGAAGAGPAPRNGKSKLGQQANQPAELLEAAPPPEGPAFAEPNHVILRDALLALDHERGTGAGTGSGRKAVYSRMVLPRKRGA